MLRLFAAALVLAAAPLAQSQTAEIIDVRPTRDQPILEAVGAVVDLVADGELVAENRLATLRPAASTRPAVRYRVRGVHTGDATPLLVRLAETDALRSLSTTGALAGDTSVDATFVFETVAEWAAWTERAETRALLAALADGEQGLRTELSVTR